MSARPYVGRLRHEARSLTASLLTLAVAVVSISVVHGLAAVQPAAAHGQAPICDTGETLQFSDIGAYDYGADYIWCAKTLGLTSGNGNNTFGPDGPVTHVQMAVFLVRLWHDVLGRNCPEQPHPFKIFVEDHWAADEINCLNALGLADGISENFNSPQEVLAAASITRLVVRMLNWTPHSTCDTYGDELEQAAACLVRLNIAPNSEEASSSSPATRAQMAVYLIGAWHHMVGGGQPPLPPAISDSDAGPPAGGSGTSEPTTTSSRQPVMTFDEAMSVARRLASDIRLPTVCGHLPLDSPIFMPNAKRTYRSGIHQGVDFVCPRGHDVQASLRGRVVVAVGDYDDASTSELNAILNIAKALRFTPAYTLTMLYGNHIVIDHGIIDGAGHVITLYAHLEAIDDAVRPGSQINAGQLIGRIGNSGTLAAAAGHRSQNAHLHWELHVDGQYLGIGLSTRDTRSVYRALFEHSDR